MFHVKHCTYNHGRRRPGAPGKAMGPVEENRPRVRLIL
jgi:hypothetical protein